MTAWARWIGVGCALTIAGDAWSQAEPSDGAACVAAFDAAQTSRGVGALRDARDQLAICANAACPAALRDKCVTWLGEVEHAIPTVVFAATDADGKDVTDVRVQIGDETVADTLDGRAIAVDPGTYAFRFEQDGAEPVRMQVLVKEGEKRRLLSVQFPASSSAPLPSPEPAPRRVAAPPPPEPVSEEGVSPFVFIGFGVGAAGLIVGSVTAAIAFSMFDDIEALCASATGCTADDIARGENVSHGSTAAFIVGGAGVVAGLIALVLTLPEGRVGAARIAPQIAPNALGIRGAF